MKVGIVGGGIGGLMAAYRLVEKSSDIDVVIFEKGNDILNKQTELINLKERKLDRTKAATQESMRERNKQAEVILRQTASEMKASLDNIDKKKADINRLLESLKEE